MCTSDADTAMCRGIRIDMCTSPLPQTHAGLRDEQTHTGLGDVFRRGRDSREVKMTRTGLGDELLARVGVEVPLEDALQIAAEPAKLRHGGSRA